MVLIIACISIMRITTAEDMTQILVNGLELVNRLKKKLQFITLCIFT